MGYVGNGTVCLDANECELMQPCHPGVRCINLHPGYRCDRCPTGYTGPMTEGVGVEMARLQKQVCQDINECESNNGGCNPYSECINTEVGSICLKHVRIYFVPRALNMSLCFRRVPIDAVRVKVVTSAIKRRDVIFSITSARVW